MDISKAIDTLNHNLLLGKLKLYGFEIYTLTFIQSFFKNRNQRTKKGDKFNKWQKFSTWRPLSLALYFSTFSINYLFLLTLLHFAAMHIIVLCIFLTKALIEVSRLRHPFAIISHRFYKRYMDLNPDKIYFETLDFNESLPVFSFNNTII